MRFEYSDEQTELERLIGGYRYVNAFDNIAKGDADKLFDLIEKAFIPPQTIIYINSFGGDVEESIKIGKIIRTHELETSIGTYVLDERRDFNWIAARRLGPGRCMSAATLMYAGGRLRHFPEGAKFGVHRFAYKNPMPENVEKSQELSAKIAEYLEQMGIPQSFLSLSARVPSCELAELSESALREHGVVTGGKTDVEWGTEMRENMLYVRGTRDSIYGRHKVALAHAKDVGFMFFAVIEAQGRQEELCRHCVVEVTVNGEEKRIDISGRCSRKTNDRDVILTSNLTEDEARHIAYSNSFGVQIRAARETGFFLGVSALDTAGGQESLKALFEHFKAR